MKAVVKEKLEVGFTYKEVPEPQILEKDQVKIKMLYSSICGTDVHIYNWDEWAQKNIVVPQINGHEGIGQIEEIGSKVSNVKVGDYVAYENHYYCKKCHVCKLGFFHACKKMKILGVHMNGVWAQKIVVWAKQLFKIPNNRQIPIKYCGMLDPIANAHHTMSYTSLENKNVLISGDGPIGIFAALIAQVKKAKNVILVGVSPLRMKIAKSCGIEVINYYKLNKHQLINKLNEVTNGEGIDVVGEFSSSKQALLDYIKIINPGGHIAVLSIYNKNNFNLPINKLVFKNISLQFVCGRKIFKTWQDSFNLINTNQIKVDNIKKIITHEFNLKDFDKAIKEIIKEKACKVLLKISDYKENIELNK